MAYILPKINFGVYIFKVLKQVHPDTGIASNAKTTVNNIVLDFADKIVKHADLLLLTTKKSTLTSREIQSAVRMVLPGELAKHAVSEGTKAVTKYNASVSGEEAPQKPARGAAKGKGRAKGHSTSARAGLTVSVSRAGRVIRSLSSNRRVGRGASVYLAAVLEYLIAEILELAGNSSRDHKKVRITTRDISLATKNDAELRSLLGKRNVVLGGGVVPHIRAELLKGKSKKEAEAS